MNPEPDRNMNDQALKQTKVWPGFRQQANRSERSVLDCSGWEEGNRDGKANFGLTSSIYLYFAI